jgi:hypothetical protein
MKLLLIGVGIALTMVIGALAWCWHCARKDEQP